MKENKLMFLNCLFITCLIIANVISSKLVILGNYFVVPAAVVSYGITFLCTDIIGEIWGKEEANKAVKRGLLTQIIATFLILFAIKIPIAPFMLDFQEKFQAVLGGSLRMTLASLAAYVVAQTNDVFIFHKLKTLNGGKYKWIRNNVNTICSQFLDTSIFITIAFYGVVPDLFLVIYSQFFIKVIIALLDTPFFYLFTKSE
ncbi:transporter [Fusobacterium necrophorum subsp. funduliforme]|uniref:queuosine precursor transporter n=1 Tax=Fusobacterium necrophorum TaxID=859 RepID=UPI000787ADD4|nr:queuosine precursor transporter [Fusobacterium necrophorum]KYM56566.1 transporter [Fusobacterium necrophorum subsp. funduliforme]